MAFEGTQVAIPGLTSTADLSAYQYHPVKMSGDMTIAPISTANAGVDYPIGILQIYFFTAYKETHLRRSAWF